jgi:hypothetical protein
MLIPKIDEPRRNTMDHYETVTLINLGSSIKQYEQPCP